VALVAAAPPPTRGGQTAVCPGRFLLALSWLQRRVTRCATHQHAPPISERRPVNSRLVTAAMIGLTNGKDPSLDKAAACQQRPPVRGCRRHSFRFGALPRNLLSPNGKGEGKNWLGILGRVLWITHVRPESTRGVAGFLENSRFAPLAPVLFDSLWIHNGEFQRSRDRTCNPTEASRMEMLRAQIIRRSRTAGTAIKFWIRGRVTRDHTGHAMCVTRTWVAYRARARWHWISRHHRRHLCHFPSKKGCTVTYTLLHTAAHSWKSFHQLDNLFFFRKHRIAARVAFVAFIDVAQLCHGIFFSSTEDAIIDLVKFIWWWDIFTGNAIRVPSFSVSFSFKEVNLRKNESVAMRFFEHPSTYLSSATRMQVTSPGAVGRRWCELMAA